jgi:hypothetical protein
MAVGPDWGTGGPEDTPTSGGPVISGTRGTAGRSLDCETFDRFVDKAKSLGREVALGAAHVPTNPGARCEVPDPAGGVGVREDNLGAAGAQPTRYRGPSHQTCRCSSCGRLLEQRVR